MICVSYDIVKFCAEEVERQRDSPLAVLWMVNAWLRAMDICVAGFERTLTYDVIAELGSIVQPNRNAHGYRRCPVRVGEHIAPRPEDVPRLMTQLVYAFPRLTPAEAYREFEEIHPFRDGNGRVGKVIFNWLNRTLHDPQMPPDFFGCSNP